MQVLATFKKVLHTGKRQIQRWRAVIRNMEEQGTYKREIHIGFAK